MKTISILILVFTVSSSLAQVGIFTNQSRAYSRINDTSISYWDFNSSAVDMWDVKSLVNNAQFFTPSGTMAVKKGIIGNSVYFIPTINIKVLDNNTLSFGNGSVDSPFSFSFWYNPIEFNHDQFIFSKGNASFYEYEAQVMTTKKVRFGIYTDASNYLKAESNGTTNLDLWNHIVVTYDGSKTFSGIKIYINGSLQTTTNVSSGSYTGMSNTSSDFFVGGNYTLNFGTRGQLDESGLFAYALSQNDVSVLYNSGHGVPFIEPLVYDDPKYVLANRNNFMFATDNNNLFWSIDYGKTWTSRTWGIQWVSNVAVNNLWPQFSYIFDDGTLIFGTSAAMYRSIDGLKTLTTPDMQDVDRSPLVYHTPVNPIYPGSYFMQSTSAIQNYAYVNGVEVLVWGNYGNVPAMAMGGTPTQLWYSADKGATIRRFYRSGDNVTHRDDGTDDGGPTGNILNDPSNPVICLHWHCATNMPGTNIWYSCTGDITGENNWFKHVYNISTDSWITSNLRTSQVKETKWKSTGIQCIDGTIYFTSDALTSPLAERGIFSGTETDIINGTMTKVYDPGGSSTLITLEMNPVTGRLLTSGESNPQSTGFTLIDNFGSGNSTIVFVQGVNSNDLITKTFAADNRGYVKLCVGGHFTNPIRTVFVKL